MAVIEVVRLMLALALRALTFFGLLLPLSFVVASMVAMLAQAGAAIMIGMTKLVVVVVVEVGECNNRRDVHHHNHHDRCQHRHH